MDVIHMYIDTTKSGLSTGNPLFNIFRIGLIKYDNVISSDRTRYLRVTQGEYLMSTTVNW